MIVRMFSEIKIIRSFVAGRQAYQNAANSEQLEIHLTELEIRVLCALWSYLNQDVPYQ